VPSGDSSGDPALTATATIMGSPSYMSPEQLRSTKEVDARTDVWALGAVLYEAMTGKPAFRGETVPQVCFLIGSEESRAPVDPPRGDPGGARARAPCVPRQEGRDSGDAGGPGAGAGGPGATEGARIARAVEAVLGAQPSKPKEVSSPLSLRAAEEVARTQASWGDDRKGKRGGGGLLVLLAVIAASVLGVGIYTGRVDVKSMRGPVKSAASAVGSVVAGATAAVESAIPSTLPVPTLDVVPRAVRERVRRRRGRRACGRRVVGGRQRCDAAEVRSAGAHAVAAEAEALREQDGAPEALRRRPSTGRRRRAFHG